MRAFTIALPMCTWWTTRRLRSVLQRCAVWLVMMETILTRGHLVPGSLPPRRPNRLNRKCGSSVWDPLESVNSICYPGESPAFPPHSAITRFITLTIRNRPQSRSSLRSLLPYELPTGKVVFTWTLGSCAPPQQTTPVQINRLIGWSAHTMATPHTSSSLMRCLGMHECSSQNLKIPPSILFGHSSIYMVRGCTHKIGQIFFLLK